MAYDDSDSDYSSPKTMAMQPARNAAEAQMQVEQLKRDSQQKIISTLTIREEEKNGHKKYHWLWFDVPKEAVPMLTYVGSTLPTIISGWAGEALYNNSSALYERLNNKFKFVGADKVSLNAHKYGLRTAAAFSAGLIAIQPTFGVVNSFRNKSKERKEIRDNMATILAADKKAYAANEVIQTAMEKTHEHFVDGLKHVAADLPAVLMSGYFAFCDHKKLVADKTAKQEQAEIARGGASAFNIEQDKKQAQLDAKRKELQAKYGEDKTAFDDAWADYRSDLNQEWHRLRTGQHTTEKPKSELGAEAKVAVVAGAGLLGSMIKGIISKDDDRKKRKTAYEQIMKLKEEADAGTLKDANLTNRIIDIFQHNEVDRGRTKFGPALLEKLQPLAERMGEVVASGELDPLALVNLVGDRKVVNKRRFISSEDLEDLLDAQRKVFSTHEKTPLDEFLADFQNPTMIMKAVKENLQNLRGSERAVFASLFSDDVLLHAGIKKSEIVPLRAQGHDFMYEFVKRSAFEMGKKTDEELKQEGLSVQHIENIRALNELLDQGNEKELHTMIDRGDPVVAAARNVALGQQLKGSSARKIWADAVKKGPTTAEIVAAQKAKKEQETALTEKAGVNVDASALDEEPKDKSAVSRVEKSRSDDGQGVSPA